MNWARPAFGIFIGKVRGKLSTFLVRNSNNMEQPHVFNMFSICFQYVFNMFSICFISIVPVDASGCWQDVELKQDEDVLDTWFSCQAEILRF